jgi:hypothetical protein
MFFCDLQVAVLSISMQIYIQAFLFFRKSCLEVTIITHTDPKQIGCNHKKPYELEYRTHNVKIESQRKENAITKHTEQSKQICAGDKENEPRSGRIFTLHSTVSGGQGQ